MISITSALYLLLYSDGGMQCRQTPILVVLFQFIHFLFTSFAVGFSHMLSTLAFLKLEKAAESMIPWISSSLIFFLIFLSLMKGLLAWDGWIYVFVLGERSESRLFVFCELEDLWDWGLKNPNRSNVWKRRHFST